MLTVETKRKIIEDADGSKREMSFVIVNDFQDLESFYNGGSYPSAHLYNTQVINILTSYTFKEVGKHFSMFGYGIDVEWWDGHFDVDIYCSEFYKRIIPGIEINLQLQEWEHWAKPWSMASIAEGLETSISELNHPQLTYWQDSESILNGFGVRYSPTTTDLQIDDEVNVLLAILKNIILNVHKTLLAALDESAVLSYFHFPEEIKAVSKQYLIYFAQFMADMGIMVDTELREELNCTLFKVLPKDQTESLDKIREALEIYLNAPSNRNFEIELSHQSDIAVKQWEANYYHLKSQITLLSSIVQAKEAAIEALQLSNYQYQLLLKGDPLKKEFDKEDIIPGIFALKKYDGKGFEIDLPQILRKLKRIIR